MAFISQHSHCPLQKEQAEQEGVPVSPEPTYITVHTVNGCQVAVTPEMMVGDGTGAMQHVVMEAGDGVSENMVLQVQCISLNLL